MDISREAYTFTKQAQMRLEESARPMFADLVKEWALFNWEDALVFQLYPIIGDDVVDEQLLVSIDELVSALRGEDGTEPLDLEELNSINWEDDLARNATLIKRLYRTIYFCINKDDSRLAMALRLKLDPFMIIRGGDKPDQVQVAEAIIAPYNVLCVYFFYLLPKELAYYLFASGFIVAALESGFDWEQVIRDTAERTVSFNLRSNLCIELAASLADNPTSLGRDVNGVAKDVKYWIDNFRIFSKGEFGGQAWSAFLTDDSYFGGCSSEDKDLISQILQLYTHLINGFLIVPQGDLSAVDRRMKEIEKENDIDRSGSGVTTDKSQVKPGVNIDNAGEGNFTISNETVRKIIISEFGYTPDGQYENLEEVLGRLAELAVDFNRPEIADLYYFDEEQNKFVWRP